MNIDVLRESVAFPLLRRGDNFVIKRVGAYNMTQWMQFITLRPAVVMIDETGKPHIIRERETVDTITHSEVVPIHLKK
jgi:diaminopimelate decarboxylase